ncbi:S66 family peptidase [Psychrobacillus vulpis]|uniref:LD-carboxypeptidase n=1 Tax=Psychrobacillus vulpis TaxID=2325572 RepID=A0A544TPI0_9BACI|nr:S66 peptidase family protein [Psychrobacillus vulpis]TQR19364.1 LD-carboxypeptidase [Psychrobacillus vulpis]
MLKKPKMLQAGDKVATISLSWGGAGEPDLKWRYDQGVERLKNVFQLEVVPMPNSLKGADYLYENPKARAEDLMNAFKDPTIKGIISNIGGSESIRLLPFIDFDVIRDNPKVFIGYSDATVTHLFLHKAGIASFYGPAILTDFAENVEMHEYTVEALKKTLFSNEVIGEVKTAPEWTSERLLWNIENKNIQRKMKPNKGYEVLQGSGVVQGRLIGGCIEVLEFAKGTSLWPEQSSWKDSILFFETSEDMPEPALIEYWLRNYGSQGILQNAKGIIFGKPQHEKYYEEYKESILRIMKELDLLELPILYNLNFGHTEPKFVLPYGAVAEINCENATFSILDSGVE